jgi:arylsulfatase
MRPTLGGTLLLSIACQALFSDEIPPGAARPNIVLIMVDDLGWSDLGCYGGEIPTPNIDSLAGDGLRFTQFYNNAVCGATRASLLTGLYCQQVGHSGRAWNQPKDFTKCVLLPELLQASGCRTMMVGKWQGRDLAVERGFDRFFGPNCQSKISYFHEVHGNDFYLDDRRWRFPTEGFFMTDVFSDYANRFLKQAVAQDDPFFLYLAYIAPHWPLHAPEQYIAPHRERYRKQGWDAWRAKRLQRQKDLRLLADTTQLAPKDRAIRNWQDDLHKEWQAERMAVYSAQIARIDHGVGRLLETLRKSGKTDNTLIMFLSDNGAAPDGGPQPTQRGFGFDADGTGPAFRRDGVNVRGGSGPNNMPGPADTFAGYGIAWATTSNTPFRSTKSTAYEGGIRTPLIARWPAVIRGGGLVSQPGHVIDMLSTCLDVANVEYPTSFKDRSPLPLEGSSLLPIFRGKQRQEPRALFFSVPRNQAVRIGDWKLVNAQRGAPWELYDLKTDPTETNNVAGHHPERVEEMAAAFDNWQSRVGDN